MDFEWDPKKARTNHSKHSVDFAFAIRVFDDLDALSTFDDSDGEERDDCWQDWHLYFRRRLHCAQGSKAHHHSQEGYPR